MARKKKTYDKEEQMAVQPSEVKSAQPKIKKELPKGDIKDHPKFDKFKRSTH